jgi:hypothetical protein
MGLYAKKILFTLQDVTGTYFNKGIFLGAVFSAVVISFKYPTDAFKCQKSGISFQHCLPVGHTFTSLLSHNTNVHRFLQRKSLAFLNVFVFPGSQPELLQMWAIVQAAFGLVNVVVFTVEINCFCPGSPSC